ncbi:hypothetical protein J5H75_27340 [Pseudomonas asiatica]|uniref:hypothetical protein n=1 Tax=Pseudomonas asiatica TaxID=2219225 RepID=UPI001AAF5C9A|nr:hypothetical protein [Pseudomonas asiatica]MBO2925387.1 hypothetical protein [Pseudomonas asiatica]
MNIHELHEQYSLEAHRLVAKKLFADPGLLDVAKANLAKIASELSDSSIAVQEWNIILKCKVESICEFITQDNDHLRELRQSSPFSGIISETEREALREAIYGRFT